MIETSRFLELKDDLRAAVSAGRIEDAHRLAEEALAEARENGDSEAVDLSLCNRATVRILRGDKTDELPALKAVLMRNTHPVVAFAAAYAAAQEYRNRRDFKKAVFYAKVARDRSEQIAGHPGRGAALYQLGTVCLDENRIDQALDAFESARRIFVTTQPQDELALALCEDNLGYCCFLRGRSAEGFERCHAALERLTRIGAEPYTAQVHLDLTFGSIESNDLDRARQHGRRALALARAHRDELVYKNSLYLLGEASHLSGDPDEERECFDELTRVYPEVRYLGDFLFSVDLKQVLNLRA